MKHNVGFEGKILFAVHFQIQTCMESYLSKLSTFIVFSLICVKINQLRIGLGSEMMNLLKSTRLVLECLDIWFLRKNPRSRPFSCRVILSLLCICICPCHCLCLCLCVEWSCGLLRLGIFSDLSCGSVAHIRLVAALIRSGKK